MASKLAYMVAAEENEVLVGILKDIEQQALLEPLCLLFDGAIMHTRDEAERHMLRACIDGCMKKFNVSINIDW